MHTLILNWLAARLLVRIIRNEEGAPYLLRLRLRGWMPTDPRPFRWSAYLHKFLLPDLDRALHNHPWKWSFSLVLAGGYTEQRLARDGRIVTRRLRPGMVNILGPKSFHRVTELHGAETWTLFVAGPKFKDWGFLDKARGFISHRARFAERGIPLPAGA